MSLESIQCKESLYGDIPKQLFLNSFSPINSTVVICCGSEKGGRSSLDGQVDVEERCQQFSHSILGGEKHSVYSNLEVQGCTKDIFP